MKFGFSWVDRNCLAKLSRLGEEHLCFAGTVSMSAFNIFFLIIYIESLINPSSSPEIPEPYENGKNLHLSVNKRTSSNEDNFLKQCSSFRHKGSTCFLN